MKNEENQVDVLIIGSGGAGCAAAIEAKQHIKRVLIVTAGDFFDSKTARAQGGIQAAIDAKDSPQYHYKDTMAAGEHENKQALVQYLTDNALSTIKWLETCGICFDKKDEHYKLQNAAGLSYPRILSCGDASGNKIMKPLQATIIASGVAVKENSAVTNIQNKNHLFHVTLYNKQSQEQTKLQAKVIIIAAGGAVSREKRAGLDGVSNFKIPDSIDLARSMGLMLVNPNLMQFHPTGIVLPKEMRRKPVPEVLRFAGATLLNKHHYEFTNARLTRKKLCDAIIAECEAGHCVITEDGRKGVWLDTPRIDEEKGKGFIEKNYQSLYKKMLKYGHDISKAPILVYPIAHYSLGGIEIDVHCQTSVAGVYAAGECTWGVHGKDRLMGNSLLDIFVFGRRAGQSAVAYLNK